MAKTQVKPDNFEEYLQGFPGDVQKILHQVRKTIREEAPDASELISYGIPTFKLHGNLVHFGAYKNHIGFYPAPSGVKEFQEELSSYKSGKGSMKFPLNRPVPYDLIRRITRYRVKENLEKAGTEL